MTRKQILDIILLALSAAIMVTKAVTDKDNALEISEAIKETSEE